MNLELVLFFILAAIAIATAIGMITSRSTVYAALHLVVNFVSVAIFYLLLDAPFIALSQVAIYAGAIMVLFLFVIMLLGGEQLPLAEPIRGQRVFAIVLAAIFLAEMALFVVMRGSPVIAGQPVDPAFSTPATLGTLLFESYLLPFEMTAGLLLAATVGAIFLTRQPRPERSGGGSSVAAKGEE